MIILLLEASNLVHVDRVEIALRLLLIGGQGLVLDGLETDGGVVADADNQDAAALEVALVVVFIGEGDVDLRHVVGGMRGGTRVLEHGLAVAADDEDARAAVVGSLDCQAAVVCHALAVVVGRQSVLLHLALEALAADKEESRSDDQTEENEAEEDEGEVDEVVVAVVDISGDVGLADD